MISKRLFWFLKIIAYGFFVIMFSSCASIIKGGDQVMNIKTDPPQAKCIISNLRSGQEVAHVTTPSATVLKKGDGYFSKGTYKVSCEKEGYEKKDVSLEGNLSGWYVAGNILIGGLIGWFIVDPITGAMWYLEPENVDLTLSKKSEAPPTVGSVIRDAVTPQAPPQPVKVSDKPVTPAPAQTPATSSPTQTPTTAVTPAQKPAQTPQQEPKIIFIK